MNKSKLVGALFGLLLLGAGCAKVDDMPGGPGVNQLNLGTGATSIAEGQYWLHNVLLWVCLVIFILVFAVMFYSIFAHRKSKGAIPANFHESTAVEIAWTVVPLIIVVVLGVIATKDVIAQKDTASADVTIKATGYQWKWGYDYVNGEGTGISFLSTLTTPRSQIDGRDPKSVTYLSEVDNNVVVPAGKKIRVITTANDVIHAWAVPAFGVKQDAIPGFVRDLWFKVDKPGLYRGWCSELCGKDHAFMPIVVEVKTPDEYTKWVASKNTEMMANADDPTRDWTLEELTARGKTVYDAQCAACHQPTGKGVPGAFPALAGSKIVLGDPAAQIEILLKGKTGTAMASFKHLSDVELSAVTTYTRSAFDNKAEKNLVQPREFTAAR
ncbi:MAG: cytochrome c oxidase subunit II [Burkholderiaceae bacterium]